MILLLLAGMIALQTDGQTEQLEFLRLAYKANKDAFSFGTFRFDYTRGSAANVSDAMSEVFSKSVEEAGFFAFEGKNARFELIADPKGLAAMTTRVNEHTVSSVASSFRSLTDGESTLLDLMMPDPSGTALIHGRAEVYPGSAQFYSSAYFEFPLLLGSDEPRAFDLFRDLNEVKNGGMSVEELDFDSELDGLKVCKLSIRYKSGKCSYWIDLNRGCLPVRVFNRYDAGSESTMIFSQLERISNAGWLPRRRLSVVANGAVVDRLVVTEIDTLHKPTASVFELEFPEPTVLVDRTKKLASTGRKKWSLLNRPIAVSAATRPFLQTPAPAEMPGEIDGLPRWALIALAVSGLALVAASIVVLRRRKQVAGGI
jgi:hypothetical protein